MRKLILIAIALFSINAVFGQAKKFAGTFEEAKLAAKKSGKILLVNCTSKGG